ncbi:MAG: AAA family ATPase [Fimbriimonadia bacterium]|jgi:proteasome-associated ATPase
MSDSVFDGTRDEEQRGSNALAILEELIRMVPRDNPRLLNYLRSLQVRLQMDAEDREKMQQALAEFEEAYEKLTSPANRVCVYLGKKDDYALIALGDTEFVANLDPKADLANLQPGTQVRVNEAYTVLEDLGVHSGGQIVKVTDVYDEGRLRVATDVQGSGGRIVRRGAPIMDAKIEPGDEVRMDPTFRLAVEHYGRNEVRDYYLEDVPELPWSKVGGQEEAIRLIKDTIEYPLLHPEVYRRFDKKPIKGILLYGPPGCGKTLIGKATAYNLTQEYSKVRGEKVEEYFMFISGPRILNMWLGETERMVREIFTTAREKASDGKLVFIFIDECESILRTRSSGRWLNISNTVVPQFCAEMDGLVELQNVVVMLTSNRPDYIDPAVLRPERIDRKVKIGRPDRLATEDILRIYLHSGVPLDPALRAEFDGDSDAARECAIHRAAEYLWRRTTETQFLTVFLRNGSRDVLHWSDLVSGALLKSSVDRAKDYAIRRAIEQGEQDGGVSVEDLTTAIRTEFRENEIFPKTDTQEDWLKLLDYEAEDVAGLKPVREDDYDALQGQIV